MIWFVATMAHAVDLDELVVAYTQITAGVGGADGVDRATGVVLDPVGNAVVVGWLDGEADHGTDGVVYSYTPEGPVGWSLVLDAGPIGADRPTSDDRMLAVGIDPSFGDLVFCGRSGATAATDPTGRYHVESRGFGTPPAEVWSLDAADGAASDLQECRGIARANDVVISTGWSLHDTDYGRWLSYRFDAGNGQVIQPLITDSADYEAVPDMAHAVAIHTTDDAFALVGELGASGLAGSDFNDTNWHVRSYDGAGALGWEDTVDGGGLLMDRAAAVVMDPNTGDVIVAGSLNYGIDNGPGQDRDWYVVRYDGNGDGLGGPLKIWQVAYESVSGADEYATAVQVDDNGDVLVAGTTIDPTTGRARWRVARLSGYDGVQLQEWTGPAWGGEAVPYALSYRLGKIAVAGAVDDGAGDDFALTVLEADLDDDGVSDSVDACPDDPAKAGDGGVCGCNVPDVDTDGDGFENCIEDCFDDPDKQDPGICGCDEPDVDTDGDGTEDCTDHCPDDPEKVEWGVCGCGVADADSDGDGVLGCDDACSNTPPDSVVDEFGCPTSNGDGTGDTGAQPPPPDDGKGCGCAASPGAGGLAWFAPLALAWRRRRL
ncbi:MAG: hypothetical protein ABMA64_08570 [Myxococcota bacterium]